MPQMADIVIKKADGTTNVTYSAITASAGDGQPAFWRNNTSATLRGNRWNLSAVARPNGPNTARRVTVKFMAPIVAMVEGQELVVNTIPMETTAVVPNGLTDADINEAVHQGINLMGCTLIRTVFSDGFGPV